MISKLFSKNPVFMCFGGGGGGGGGGGSRADQKGAQANLGGGGYQAQYSDRDDREQQQADQRRRQQAAAKIARDRAASDQRAREAAQAQAAQEQARQQQAQAAQAAQQAEIQRMQEAQARQAEQARQAAEAQAQQQARQAAEAQAAQEARQAAEAQAAQEAEVQRMLAAQARQQQEQVAQAQQQPANFTQSLFGRELLAPVPTFDTSPLIGGLSGIQDAQFVSKDTTPSYMSYFEPIEEPVIGGRGNINPNVFDRIGAINQMPTGSLDPSPDSLINTFDSNPSFDGSDITSYLDDIGGDSFDPRGNQIGSPEAGFSNVSTEPELELESFTPPPEFGGLPNQIGSPELPPSQFYAGMDGPTAQESFSPQFYAGMDGPEPSNLYNSSAIEDEMDFVPRQGPVQADPVAPPRDEMDLSSQDANFYDEIPNDFANFTTPGNDSGMEMNLNSSDANFYDDIAFQPDPINDILAGEQFTTSAANAPSYISTTPPMRPDNLGVDPVSMESNVGVLGNAIANAPTFATTTADYTGLERTYNTQAEETANFFTPSDGASYVRGQLVDDATGDPIVAGGMTSTNRKIGGYMDNLENNLEGFGGLGAGAIRNSGRETFANMITPGDNAAYVNGQLINTLTGESLQGGGFTIDPVTGEKDYIYGVSDDYSNNLQVDTTGMSETDARAAVANQIMRRDIAPNDLAYFASFLPGLISPMFGGKIGEQMLAGGIERRNSIIAEQTAALEAGARPIYNEKGEYVGYSGSLPSSSSYGNPNAGGSQGTVNYDPSSYNNQETRKYAPNERDSMLDQDENNTTRDNTDGINNLPPEAITIYNRYYRGGSGYGLPAWLRRYASGVSIDQLLTKETLDDGTVMYKTPDGKYIDAKYLPNAIVGADEEAQ